jgi:hypothetical protein
MLLGSQLTALSQLLFKAVAIFAVQADSTAISIVVLIGKRSLQRARNATLDFFFTKRLKKA